MALAIKRVNLPPRLNYVSVLPDITQKPKTYVVFLSVEQVALKRTGFSEKSQLCVWITLSVRSDVPLPLHSRTRLSGRRLPSCRPRSSWLTVSRQYDAGHPSYDVRHWETEHLPSPDRVSGTAFLLPSVIRHCRRQSSESC